MPLRRKIRDLYRRNREKHSSSSSSSEYYSPIPLPLIRDFQCDVTVRPPLLRNQKPIMYSPIDTDDEYVCNNGDMLASANEGRRLSDVGRYRQSRMRLKSTARKALGSSSLSSSSEQRSISSSTGSFGVDTDSNFASFDSQSSRGSCCSLPATRQRTSLAKTRWPLPRGKQNPKLLHQYSDSVVFGGTRKMHQDLKMSRVSSDSSTDSPRQLPGETIGPKAAKTGAHPRKKMLRSQSESAIDVSMIRPIKGAKGATGGVEKGIVVSNNDLLKILSEAQKFVPPPPPKRRSHKVLATLGTTPESPQEISESSEVQTSNLDKKCVSKSSSPEKEGAKLKGKRASPRISRHSSLHVNLPNRPSANRSRAVDVLQLSPVRAPQEHRPVAPTGMNKNCLVPPANSVIRERPKYGSTLPRCPSPSELEPMLKKDDNGNQLIEEDEEEADMMEEKQIQPEQSTSDLIENIEDKNESDAPSSSTDAFDPSLLGEAIERHLSLQKSTSPNRSSKKARSGAALWKGLWNQDKLGSILTKLPFKKDSTDGVTV